MRRSSARHADITSLKMVCKSEDGRGPALFAATRAKTWASRSGRKTGALVSALTCPTS